MAMELKIYNPTEDGFVKEINWNHEEIRAEVERQVELYKNLVYTDEQIKDAKADRAKLNKFVDVLETKRKEIKNLCLSPYEKFEEQMKKITALVKEPIALIDSQVKEYEKQQKEQKKAAIQELFTRIGFQDFVTLDKIWSEKWLNASVSMKKIEEEMTERLHAIGSDVMTIHNLPEFSFEALEEYKRNLNLADAIREGQRLSDIQKRKLEHEAKQIAFAKAQAARKAEQKMQMEEPQKQEAFMAAPEPEESRQQEADAFPQPAAVSQKQEPGRQWISFKALLSVEDAQALKQFFESRNIQFKSV